MFVFRPWRPVTAVRDKTVLAAWLDRVGREGRETLRQGIRNPPKTGRLYGRHRASAPGEYPANETGRLARSVRCRRGPNEVTIGSTVFYGRFLADGTRKMLPRKMSKEALESTTKKTRRELRGWLYFGRDKGRANVVS